MTPRELLALTPKKIERDFSCLFDGWRSFVPEVGCEASSFVTTESERIEVRVYEHHVFSCMRRIWRLAAVFFDGLPVMIMQSAGREGDDHTHRFVVDVASYHAMVGHMLSLMREDAIDDRDTGRVSMDDDIPDLARFYGCELGGRFEG